MMRVVRVTLSTGEVLDKDMDAREVVDLRRSVEEPTMVLWRSAGDGRSREVRISSAHIVKIEEERP